ncbi:MAG: hypothetical protein QMD23_07575 [Candidatus Bathyarchaeia archaeon]|nr:hypothetical protein [Candidatus Bathyarchaeia archaeon]
MDVIEWVRGAVVIMIGAFILYVIFSEFCKVRSDFYEIGWPLLAAFIAGAILYLKYGLSKQY